MNVLMKKTIDIKAVDIWNVFKINTMAYYHDLYLKTDALLVHVWINLGSNAKND